MEWAITNGRSLDDLTVARMSHVVLIRGANVGGRNLFRPARLAAALTDLDVVNVGAAGTFLVRAKASAATIRRSFLEQLPFEPGIVVCPARDILELVESRPFKAIEATRDLRGWVSALCARPKARPELPLIKPPGKAWSVRFERVDGAFALGLWQRQPKGFISPNEVVEKALGVPATMRYWETFEKVAKLIGT